MEHREKGDLCDISSEDIASDEMTGSSNSSCSSSLKGPLSCWNEQEMMNGSVVRSTTVILKGKGCTFSKMEPCHMCGYNNDATSNGSEVGLLQQLKTIRGALVGSPYIKLFTSGSFLDPVEVDEAEQNAVIEYIDSISESSRILFECRPEFINDRSLKRILDIHDDIEIAIGLESIDPRVRTRLIGKAFSNDEFFRAADLITDRGVQLKVYLLMKPPFLSELGSIYDVMYSMEAISKRYEGCTVSINPMNVQRGTLVEKLFNANSYRTPWLWSLSQILFHSTISTEGRLRIVSHPTGGGKLRGAHNCGKCDPMFLDAIDTFNMTADPDSLDLDIDCCRNEWLEELTSG